MDWGRRRRGGRWVCLQKGNMKDTGDDGIVLYLDCGGYTNLQFVGLNYTELNTNTHVRTHTHKHK